MVANELTASEAFATLLHDPFANYVIQTLLTVGKDGKRPEGYTSGPDAFKTTFNP